MPKSSPVSVTAGYTSLSRIGNDTWKSISTSRDASAAIKNDNKLYVWGSGSVTGELTNLQSWTVVSHGRSHTAAIRGDGRLFTWGINTSGELGNGTTILTTSPIVIGTESWQTVSAGWSATGAIHANGALYMWGAGQFGQLGIDDITSTPTNRSSPVKVGDRSWTKLSVGNNVTAAITSNGELFAWGSNWAGQLGNGAVIGLRNGGGYDPLLIGGNRTTIIIEKDGVSGSNLFAWGTSVGDNTVLNRSSPVAVSTSITNWSFIADGCSGTGAHKGAIASNGALYMWGAGESGQLGQGTTVTTSSPIKIGSESWTKIALGEQHTLGILANGALYVWGSGASGRLGDGTTVSKSSPIKIGSESWTEVAAGQFTSYAIRSDGTLYSWGNAANGLLGNNDELLISRSSPVQIAGSWSKISATDSHVLATNSTGYMFGWGRNDFGQLGKTGETFEVKKVYSWSKVAAGKSALAISGGTMIATNSTGILFGWGLNTSGQLGNGTTISRSSPVQIGSESWNFIACGGDSISAAIHGNGALFTWGSGSTGVLGDGTTVSKSSPVKIGNESWSMVSVYSLVCAAIHANGALFTWGAGANGILGDGTTVSKSSPVKIGNESWLTVDVGLAHMTGILANGAIYVWGLNTSGQIGDGTTISKSSPVKIGASSWASVAAGQTHTAAITSGNVVFAWGGSSQGEVGLGLTTNRSSPVAVAGILTSRVRPDKIVAAHNYNAALDTANGRVWIWGLGTSGQLGEATGRGTVQKAISRSQPVSLSNYGSRVLDCFAGGDFSFTSQAPALGFVRSDGSYWIWGNNGASGIWGNGTTSLTTRTGPDYLTTTLASSDWIAGSMKEGNGAAYGIKENYELFAWGRNTVGQLGIGQTTLRSSPVSVGTAGGIGYSAVFALSAGAAAIDRNGGLYTWGLGTSGQLGDGTAVTKSAPVKIGSESWTMVSGTNYCLGIHANGALFAWGTGTAGQLGDGTTTNKSSPVQIGSESWQFVYAGGTSAYAIHANGALFAWGENRDGCLGDGTTIPKSSPVKIGNSSWKFVAAHADATASSPGCAAGITTDGYLYTWGFTFSGASTTNSTDVISHPYWKTSQSSPVQLGTRNDWEEVKYWGRAAGVNQRGMMGIAGGQLFVWGGNGGNFNLIGDGGAQSRSSPTLIYGGNYDKVTHLSLGAFNAAAVTANGLLYTWGLGAGGALGCEDTASRSSPTQLGTVNYYISPTPITSHRIDSIGLSWIDVKAGATHSAAIDSSSNIFTWGLNTSGQLGINLTTNRTVPFQINQDITTVPSNFTAVKVTGDGTIAATSSNTIYSWGAGANIGDNTTVAKSSPVLLGSANFRASPVKIGSSSWIHVSTSNNFMMAIRNDGALFGWGFTQAGFPHIGDQSIVPKSSPVLVAGTPGTLSWIQVSAGHTHSLAITNTNGLYAWGNNQFGQCGVGTVVAGTTNILFSPTAVGSSSWSKVSAGQFHSLAADISGNVFSFGLNTSGQLGIGLTTNRSSPVFVAANGFSDVYAGEGVSSMIRSSNSLFIWGLNNSGQLGNLTTVNRSSPIFLEYDGKVSQFYNHSPILVGGDRSWRRVSAGNNMIAATTSNNMLHLWGVNGLVANRLGANAAFALAPVAVGLSAANVSVGNIHSAFIESIP